MKKEYYIVFKNGTSLLFHIPEKWRVTMGPLMPGKDAHNMAVRVYAGNKLPPFYIGHSTVNKVIEKKYHGSPDSIKYSKIWKEELKHNPNLFKTTILTTHTDRSSALNQESKFQKQLNVVSSSLYINMSIADSHMHYNCVGRKMSDESKKKMAKAKLGKPGACIGFRHTEEAKLKMSEMQKKRNSSGVNSPRYGKRHTEETKQLISEKKKKFYESNVSPRLNTTHTEETKQKIRIALTGKPRKPHSEESKKKMSEARRRTIEKKKEIYNAII